MALKALSLKRVQAMDKAGRTRYFEGYARYFCESPPNQPYAIRVGSTTLFSHDTMDLRKQFDKLLRYGKPLSGRGPK